MSTILLLTANDKNQYLDNLTKEVSDVQTLLYATERRNFDIQLIPEADTQRIIDALNVTNREIEILHYAGHADGNFLRLMGTNAITEALAQKMSSYPKLKLAVGLINGTLSNGKKLFELLKELPFTLGKWIQQIAAERDEKTLDYYCELLYNYIFLIDNLLHHIASILLVEI